MQPAARLRVRVRNAISWNFAATVATQGSTFLTNIILARLMGKSVFGEYAMTQSTLLSISLLAMCATGSTTTKYVAEFRSVDKEKTGRVLGLCSLVSAITAITAGLFLAIASPWLAAGFLKAPHLTISLLIGSGAIVFAVLNGFQTGALAGLESYRSLAKVALASGSCSFVICTGLGWVAGLNGAVAGLLVAGGIQWLILKHHLAKAFALQNIRLSFCELGRERRVLTQFALPAAAGSFVSMPMLWLANASLVRQTDGYSQMALFAAANNIRTLVLFLPNIINNVGMSLINNQKGHGNRRAYRQLFWSNLAVTATVALGGAVAAALLAPTILSLYGKSFGAALPVFKVLLVAAVIESLATAIYQVIQSQEKMLQSLLFIAMPRDIGIMLLAVYLTPVHGALGLGQAYALAWALALIPYVWTAVRASLPKPAISAKKLSTSPT